MPTVLILLLALSTLLLASAVRRVPTGQVYSLYRGGKLVRVLGEGTHLVLPWRGRVAHKIDLNGQILRLDDASTPRGTVYWQVLEPERADAVIDEVSELIRRGAQAALRNEPAANHHELGAHVKQALNGSLRERGMMVTRVELEAA